MSVAKDFIRRLAVDRRGATAVIVALSLTVLMGFAGLAVDVGLWYRDKRLAQGAADSAAYSAAVDRAAGDTAAGAIAAAKAITAQYGLVDGAGGVSVVVNLPPASGPNAATAGAAEVIVTVPETLFFTRLFISSASVAGRAVAVSGASGGKYCVEALDPSSSKTTVSINNGATVDTSACGMAVNASGSAALAVTSGGVLNAANVSIVGNYVTNNGGQLNVTGKTLTSAPAVTDPYAGVAVPAAGACTGPASYANGGAHYNITPGTYCSGFSVGNGATVTMAPGVYIVKGGSFSLQGGTTVTGTGVTIVLTGSGGNYATANIANGVTLNLAAPTSGATSGLAIFQDRLAPTSGSNAIAGGASMLVTGALYFPHQTVNFSNASTNSDSCTQLIAYDLSFSGGSKFSNNCTGAGTTGIGSAATTLVE